MMTKVEFHNALRILRSIDSHELGDPEWWPKFRDDPYRFFIRCNDADRETIWKIVERRQTASIVD